MAKQDEGLIQIGPGDAERRRRYVDLGPEDVARIAAIREAVLDGLNELVDGFFNYLSRIEEAQPFFRKRDLVEEARRLKREHLIAMVSGEYGAAYVEQRLLMGQLYGRGQLDSRIFLGAFHSLVVNMGRRILARFAKDPAAGFEHFVSLEKLAFLDLGVIMDAMILDREQTILRQQEAIRELSTPALQVRERLLILPIIGLLDSHRAKQLTDGLLRAVRDNRAKVVVMDVTGVATVDSKVANHLIQTVAAARLMGAVVIVTGLSADVAQSLVTLGVDLSKLNTIGDLQGGLEEAERLLGFQLLGPRDARPAQA
jgi:rsbT co-antagonist protein RsbR